MMSATVPVTHQLPAIVGGGKWVWRDDTNVLEYIGSNIFLNQDIGESRQQRKPKISDKKKERTTPLNQLAQPTGHHRHHQPTNSYREHHFNLPKVVTLGDVKAVALAKLQEDGMISPPVISSNSKFVDEIIIRTLQFFHYYFIVDEHSKPKTCLISLSEQSQDERDKEEYDKKMLVDSNKKLSAVYSAILLGLHSHDIHHLNGGRLRYSKTRKDKEFYESLYQLLIHCTVLNFETADPDVIRAEMGRLFRSESFNINKREQNQKMLEARYPDYFKLKGLNEPNSGPSPAEYRRLRRSQKNPFGKAITKQSPMIQEMLRNSPHPAAQQDTLEDSDMLNELMCCDGIGIIGSSIRDYDLATLKKRTEKEKKEMEEEFSSRSTSRAGSERSLSAMSNTSK